jgi:hypothetical protein
MKVALLYDEGRQRASERLSLAIGGDSHNDPAEEPVFSRDGKLLAKMIAAGLNVI